MYKEDLALDKQQWLIWYKTHPNWIINYNTYKKDLALTTQQWLICHKTHTNLFIGIK